MASALTINPENKRAIISAVRPENHHALRIAYLESIGSGRLDSTQLCNLVTVAELIVSPEAFAIILRAAIRNASLDDKNKLSMVVKLLLYTGVGADAEFVRGRDAKEIKRAIVSEFQSKHETLKGRQDLDHIFRDVLIDDFFMLMRECFQSYQVTDANCTLVRPNRHRLADAIVQNRTDSESFGGVFTSGSSLTYRLSLELRDLSNNGPS